jgi:hypothetical protein
MTSSKNAAIPEIMLKKLFSDPSPKKTKLPQKQPKINGSNTRKIKSRNQAKNLEAKLTLSI